MGAENPVLLTLTKAPSVSTRTRRVGYSTPFVTLLPRVHGNSETERDALARRREFDRIATALVAEAAAEGDLRADIAPGVTTRPLFGVVNSIIEWYRPQGGLGAAELVDVVVAVAFDGLRVRR